MVWGLLPWFSLMVAGLVASVALLFWGYRSGRFADQERARYLPLRDEKPALKRTGARMPEVYALAGLMAALAVLFVAAVKVAVFR